MAQAACHPSSESTCCNDKLAVKQHFRAIKDCNVIVGSLPKLPGADTAHYLENECMRQAMEGVLYTYGVDVIFNGHLHVYERTFPMYVSHHLA